MKPDPSASLLRYRFAVASRAIAAIGGGYALASAAAACFAVWLPMSRVDAVLTAQMLAFVAYACAVIWVFATHSAWRAWVGVVLPAAIFAGLWWLARVPGAA
ncbi:membrane protein [Bordetella ansorpii]|uniref:Membrane protein n=1 Tax=Bordetella ansorpii TaxID=288768 RepID=A0A157SD01_9BORD|nr:DUF3649 domain-containing protein [Bordetella ansorpii]SAI68305.1 membrane protein [Bordetella ansorpii]